MKKMEKIPLWWKVWLTTSIPVGVILFFIKGIWLAVFGAGTFLFLGAGLFCGRGDSHEEQMASGIYFFMMFIFLIGVCVIVFK